MIDLHLHSSDSDGTWRWERVLETCQALKLSAFSLTDHDTVTRIPEIRAWAQRTGAPVIPGIELSAREDKQSVHLLGYFLDGPLAALEETLKRLRDARVARNAAIIARLRKFGFDVTAEEVSTLAGHRVLGRPHIAALLVRKRAVGSFQEAFDRFLAYGKAAYVPKEDLPVRDAMDLLHGAGAVVSLAHPFLSSRREEAWDTSLRTWREWGLDAIEVYYPTHTPEQRNFFFRMATKFGFLMTGGSDFHGDYKPHLSIGVGRGDLRVEDALMMPLLARRAEITRSIGCA